MSNHAPSQLALPFGSGRTRTFFNFAGRENEELITRLGASPSGFRATWLHGVSGCGKSHLLHAAVHAQQGYGVRCLFIDASLPDAIHRLADDGEVQCLAVDGVSLLIGLRRVEVRLYERWQTLLQNGGQVIFADERSPLALEFALGDLASRCRSCQVFEVQVPDESAVRQLLQRRLRERGLTVSPAVLDYWLTRRNRAVGTLLDDLDRLDAASWREQHGLTVPFLKSVLEL
jgi:DnaA family protein